MISASCSSCGGAGQLAENQHAVHVVAGGDKFLGHQVHPIMQRRHDAEAGAAIQRDEIRQLEGSF